MVDRTLDIRISREARRALVRIQRKLGLGQVGDVLRTIDFLGLMLAPAPVDPARRLDDRIRARVSDELAMRIRALAASVSMPIERTLDAVLIESDGRIQETPPCPRTSRSQATTAATTRTVAGADCIPAWPTGSPLTSGAC